MALYVDQRTIGALEKPVVADAEKQTCDRWTTEHPTQEDVILA